MVHNDLSFILYFLCNCSPELLFITSFIICVLLIDCIYFTFILDSIIIRLIHSVNYLYMSLMMLHGR